jgi:hypothetical protein
MWDLVGLKKDLPPAIDLIFRTLGEFDPLVCGVAGLQAMTAEQNVDSVGVYVQMGKYHRLRDAINRWENVTFGLEIPSENLTVEHDGCIYNFTPHYRTNLEQTKQHMEETWQEWCDSTADAIILPHRIVRAPAIGWLDVEKRQARQLREDWGEFVEARLKAHGLKFIPRIRFNPPHRQAWPRGVSRH